MIFISKLPSLRQNLLLTSHIFPGARCTRARFGDRDTVTLVTWVLLSEGEDRFYVPQAVPQKINCQGIKMKGIQLCDREFGTDDIGTRADFF